MKDKIKTYLFILIGTFITAAAISLFFVPNKVVNGGVSGISTILYYAFKIPISVSYGLINILLLLIGLKILGWRFCVRTVVGVGLMSLFMELLSRVKPFTENILLAAVFGAVLYGLGIGITLAAKASTGGTDILGRLIQKKLPHMPIGKLLLVIDGIIIAASYIVFLDMDLILYAVAALAISTYMIDLLMKTLNVSKLAFVISEKGEEVSSLLISTSPRGVTIVDVTGGFTMEKKKMLICALKNSEIPEFERKVKKVDSDAFVIFSESQQIVGNGFIVYK